MARSTMADLIHDVRELADAAYGDSTVNGAPYWSDDQIQAILDANSRVVRYQHLEAQATLTPGGTATYSEYWSGLANWEDSPVILDSNYGTISSSTYTFDGDTGVLNFNSGGTARVVLIYGTVYNLNAAAATVWRQKASKAAGAYDVSTDNHSLKRSQLYTQYANMARTFAMMRPSWENGRGAAASGSQYAERGDMGGYDVAR